MPTKWIRSRVRAVIFLDTCALRSRCPADDRADPISRTVSAFSIWFDAVTIDFRCIISSERQNIQSHSLG